MRKSVFNSAVDRLGLRKSLRKSLRVPKATVRAARRGPAIFKGEEAFVEVAKQDGLWNWALVGPDPINLPLSGGGIGGAEEMREAIRKHTHSFGLLRMNFGVGDQARAFIVFIHASDAIDSGKYSLKDRALGLKAPDMERALRRFSTITACVHIQSVQECNVETMVNELRRSLPSEDDITVDNFNAAAEHRKSQHPEELSLKQEQEELARRVEQIEAPVATSPSCDLDSLVENPHSKILRKRVKLFSKGEAVEIFSAKHQQWMLDGQVADVALETFVMDTRKVSAGSTKVVYANGKRYKWVPAHQLEEMVRTSSRPAAPEPLVGELDVEVYLWYSTSLERKYFELSHGFLQWWSTEMDAKHGMRPSGSVYLLGLQQEQAGPSLQLRADSTHGAVYTLRADEIQLRRWVSALWVHAEYCEEECERHRASGVDEELVRRHASQHAKRLHSRRNSVAATGLMF